MRPRRAGVALVEAAIGVAVGGIVLALIGGLVWSQARQVAREEAYSAAVAHGQAAVDLLRAQLRRLAPGARSPELSADGAELAFDVREDGARRRVVVRFDAARSALRVTHGDDARELGAGAFKSARFTATDVATISYDLVVRVPAPRREELAFTGSFSLPAVARQHAYAFWEGALP